jgi:hypothetical protein
MNGFLRLSTLIILLFVCNTIFATEPTNAVDFLKKGIRINLSEDGSAYTKISFATQFWARNTWLNDGTYAQNGDPLSSEFDFALRRTRFSMLNNLNNKIIFYTQLGANNLNRNSGKPNLYFHDVWAMFELAPKACYFGFGVNGWNGISRLTNVSYQKNLTLDNPGVNIPAVNHTDLAVRQLGVFMKGTAGRVSYRAAISKPFSYDGNETTESAYEISSVKLNYKAYLAYHFLEKEYFTSSYVGMTYLGEKKIFNLGFGFDYYPESIAEQLESGETKVSDRTLLGADIFCELPFAGKQAFTLYSVLYDYDFGSNYLREYGTMNIWDGSGNAEYKAGTGLISCSMLGYLFKNDFLKLPGRLQLFYAFTAKDFDALSQTIFNHDMGANYYAAGQKLKFSVQYSLRPATQATNLSNVSSKGTLIFQTQIII